MKIRSFLSVMIIFFVFLFSGCGGSSSGSISKVDTKDYAITYSNDHKSLSGYFTVSLDSIIPQSSGYQREIKLTNFKINSSCSIRDNNMPDSLTLSDSGSISQKVNLAIDFNGECYDKNFEVTADEVITMTSSNQSSPVQQLKKNGWVKTFKIQNSSSLVSAIVAVPSDFNITYSGEKRTIYIEALDSQNNLLTKNLKISTITGSDSSKNYGSLDAYSVTTSDSSKVSLIYTAPSSIDDINGTSAEFNITDPETGNYKTVTINFIKLQNIETNLTVKDSSFIFSDNKKKASGYFTISLDQLPQNSKYTREVKLTNFVLHTTCDKISQTFTPDSITLSDNDYSAKKVNLAIDFNGPCQDNNITIEADEIVSVKYSGAATSSMSIIKKYSHDFTIQNAYSDLKDIVVVPSEFNITIPGEEKVINVFAINSNNELLERDLTLSIVYGENNDTSKNFGTLSEYNLTTSSSSKVSFTYFAPDNIDDLNGSTAYINITDNIANKTKQIKIGFTSESNLSISEYKVKLDTPSKLTVDDEKLVTVKIVNSKDENQFINETNIKDVNISIVTSSMLRFKENNLSSYEYNESNSKSLTVKSFGKAGIAMIKVDAKVFNGQSDVNISDVFPITIASGPINSISLVYNETLPYSDTKPFFTNIYTIHAVDKYGNPANKGEKIYAGLIAGVTKTAEGNDDLYSDNNGTINHDGSGGVTFDTKDKNISDTLNSDSSNKNVLVVLANENHHNPNYIGGWDIESRIDNHTLSLYAQGYDINFTSVDGVGYAIGTEKRYNVCDKTISVAHIDSSDHLYSIEDNGRADLNLTYDPYLVGKTIYLYANAAPANDSNDKRRRVGVSISEVLFGTGISHTPTTVTNDKDTNQTFTETLRVTENDRNEPVKDTNVTLTTDNGCKFVDNGVEKDRITINTGCGGGNTFDIKVPSSTTCDIFLSIVKEH